MTRLSGWGLGVWGSLGSRGCRLQVVLTSCWVCVGPYVFRVRELWVLKEFFASAVRLSQVCLVLIQDVRGGWVGGGSVFLVGSKWLPGS